MPIQDIDAAGTVRDIAKLEDIDVAGTFRAIGTVHDIDTAGTGRLIWNSETELFPAVASSHSSQYGDEGSHGNWEVSTWTSQSNRNSHIRYRLVNMTPYKTLKITGNLTSSLASSAAGFVIHNKLDWAYYSVGGGGSSYTRMHRVAANTWNGTWNVDVSGLSGNYYITTQCYSNNGSRPSTHARITKIVAE